MKTELHVLHLEDNPKDAELIRSMLEAEGLHCRVDCVKTRADFEAALGRDSFDLVLSDFTMPAFNGLAALDIARKCCPDTPFIFASGTIGEEAAIDALKRGATDYVLKDRLARLPAAVERALRETAEREQLRRAESHFRDTRRLESLGTLASGIAQNFNNLLTAILGNAELAHNRLAAHAPADEPLKQIEAASLRAAEICRQMLACAAKTGMETGQFDLNTLVEEAVGQSRASLKRNARLLRHPSDDGRLAELFPATLDEQTVLSLDLARALPRLRGAPSQIRQAVRNLLVNASEALQGEAGVIQVRTASFRAERDFLEEAVCGRELPEGNYVLLEVSDTGCGMTPEILSQIFEPFFSTKSVGRGLGLAVVYGVVHGHHGALRVRSEWGRGSQFALLLPPAASAPGASVRPPRVQAARRRGAGKVLVVDDTDMVRAAVANMVRELGFEVVEATDGLDALEKLAAGSSHYELVLMDVNMPRLDGMETLEQISRAYGDLPVVLMSGCGEETVPRVIEDLRVAAFLWKPFSTQQLRDTFATVLTPPVIVSGWAHASSPGETPPHGDTGSGFWDLLRDDE